MFIGTMTGMVSATTRHPISRARCETARWRSMRSGPWRRRRAGSSSAVGSARTDIAGSSSSSASLKPFARRRRRCPRAWCPGSGPSPRTGPGSRRCRRRGPAPDRRCRRCANVDTSVEKPSAPCGHRVAEHGAQLRELVRRRGASVGLGTQHVAAQGGVAQQEAGVDREVAVEGGEVLAEVSHDHGHAPLERLERHALDLGQHAGGCSRRRRRASAPGRSCSCRRSRW